MKKTKLHKAGDDGRDTFKISKNCSYKVDLDRHCNKPAGIISIYAVTESGIIHLSHEVTDIYRGEAEVDIKVLNWINVLFHE